jgi:hypothetical protein
MRRSGAIRFSCTEASRARRSAASARCSPKTALAVGLKVDSKKLPEDVQDAIKAGKADLDDPATTLSLLKLNAVVGVKGIFDSSGQHLTSMGITCALCHSTVDNSFAPGIGKRLDGWPNRDLNVGAIISLAPNLTPFTNLLGVDEATVKKVIAPGAPASSMPSSLDGRVRRTARPPRRVPPRGLANVDTTAPVPSVLERVRRDLGMRGRQLPTRGSTIDEVPGRGQGRLAT